MPKFTITPEAQRLREFAVEHFGTTAELARQLKITLQGLTPYLNGRQTIGSRMAQKLKDLGADVDYIKTGRQDLPAAEPVTPKKSSQTPVKQAPEKFQHDKFLRLVWYVIFRGSENLDQTKLNQVLYFTDRKMKVKFGRTIAGERYTKQEAGVDSTHLYGSLVWLQNFGYLRIEKDKQGAERYHIVELPPLHGFTAEDISIVEQTLSFLGSQYTAQLWHDDLWEKTPVGQVVRF